MHSEYITLHHCHGKFLEPIDSGCVPLSIPPARPAPRRRERSGGQGPVRRRHGSLVKSEGPRARHESQFSDGSQGAAYSRGSTSWHIPAGSFISRIRRAIGRKRSSVGEPDFAHRYDDARSSGGGRGWGIPRPAHDVLCSRRRGRSANPILEVNGLVESGIGGGNATPRSRLYPAMRAAGRCYDKAWIDTSLCWRGRVWADWPASSWELRSWPGGEGAFHWVHSLSM